MSEIDTTKPSREFDAWIAEHVMNWRQVNPNDPSLWDDGESGFGWRWLPHFTTDLTRAWDVVTHILDTTGGYGFVLKLDWHGPIVAGNGYVWASFSQLSPDRSAYAATVPLAICRAVYVTFV